MKSIILAIMFLALSPNFFSQEITKKEIVKNKIKAITITEKETGNEVKKMFTQIGEIEREGNLIKKISNKQLYITTLFVYDKYKIKYKIKFSSPKKDTTFYDYDSLGRLQFEFKQSSTYPKLTEYCYVIGYNKKDIHYTPYEIRTYRKPNFYFYPNHNKINYKNEGSFYLEGYRRGQYDLNFRSNEEFFYEPCNIEQRNLKIDSFCQRHRTITLKHSDSLVEEITLQISATAYDKEGKFIHKQGKEFGDNISVEKTMLNLYSNKKLIHQSIKEFKTDNEVTYFEIDYRYNSDGLLIDKEEYIKYYFMSIHSKPINSHSKYLFTYEFW